MFERFRVMNSLEMHARREIHLENYSKSVNIEALTLLDMLRREIIPSAIRFEDRFTCEIDIAEHFRGCLVPKLLLQPLVENALYHGIKNRRGMGTITVTGRCDGDDLLLQVTDNGAGMDEEQVRILQAGIYEDRHTGLGLVNVHKRIRLYCGEPYGLSFESQVGKGSTVSVRLPQTRIPEKEEYSK